MAIIGLTHGEDGQIENKITKFRGKISTGYGPKEGPNTKNHPVAAGHFVAMKEETKNQRIGTETITVNKWVENKDVQSKLGKTPRVLEIVSLFKSPEDMWDTFLAKYSGDGLACRGNGVGTEAKYLTHNASGEREWKTKPCTFTECPDYISGACKPNGVMKVYPTVDPTPPNPYKFETRSLNTIRNIECALEDIWNLLKTAHTVKELEAGQSLPFDGMFGLKMFITHKKTKSGGRDVFVSEIVASKEFKENIMKVINRAIEKKTEEQGLIGEAGATSLLDTAATVMLEGDTVDTDTGEVLEIANAIEDEHTESLDAAMALLDEEDEEKK